MVDEIEGRAGKESSSELPQVVQQLGGMWSRKVGDARTRGVFMVIIGVVSADGGLMMPKGEEIIIGAQSLS